MNPTITALLGILAKIVPAVAGQAGPIGVIIGELVQALPVIVPAGVDAISQVKDLIDALKADPATTDAQLAQLEEADAVVDKAFEDAAAKAEAEDEAAG